MTERISGLVLVSYGSHGVVRLEGGENLPCQYRRQVGRPFCGDRVQVSLSEEDRGVVEEIMPRSNRFLRGDARQRKHVVAVNLDQVAIVIARKPLPSRDLLERYLVAVHSLGIQPLIVLNKTDISDYDRSQAGAAVFDRIEAYRSLGYTVVETTCKAACGTDALVPQLRKRSSILVGQSGVGKSSLVRCLLPDIEVQTGALSDATGKGTHT
ncbi:MAG: ribosome small subunit-dependent GTPase A, partial [Gammaproteobacteria bacterium]|nr:ribosome small subunit-dependent GTPase A [Gammaproteobacteria bacterium]